LSLEELLLVFTTTYILRVQAILSLEALFLVFCTAYIILVRAACPVKSSLGLQHHTCYLWVRVDPILQKFLKHGNHKHVRMPYVKYKDNPTVSNTDWPSICSKRALPREFTCLWHEGMYRRTRRMLCTLGFRLDKSNATWVKVASVHTGSS
jgi:hypothetical protein